MTLFKCQFKKNEGEWTYADRETAGTADMRR